MMLILRASADFDEQYSIWWAQERRTSCASCLCRTGPSKACSIQHSDLRRYLGNRGEVLGEQSRRSTVGIGTAGRPAENSFVITNTFTISEWISRYVKFLGTLVMWIRPKFRRGILYSSNYFVLCNPHVHMLTWSSDNSRKSKDRTSLSSLFDVDEPRSKVF